MSTKLRSSPATKPEEQTTPASSFSPFRRFWPSAKQQTGSTPTSKKARYGGASEAPATGTPQPRRQGTPAAPTLIASAPPSPSPSRPATAPSDADMAPAKRNLASEFEQAAPQHVQRGSRLFGLFSPMFSLFLGRKEHTSPSSLRQAPSSVASSSLSSCSSAVASSSSSPEAESSPAQPQQEATADQSSGAATIAQPQRRRNSNVVAMDEEEGESDDSADEQPIDWDDESNPYAFIRRLPYLPRVQPSVSCAVAPKAPTAPRPTLVLDLDETLVHCSTEPVAGADVVFPVVWNGIEYRVYARKRPGLEAFMEAVSQLFEVIVFTASQQVYADKLLDIIDPQGRWFRHRVFRDACVCVEGNYLKDLSILGRELARTVIVDNSPQAFGFQYNNGIPILSWFDAQDDAELAKLLPLLRSLAAAPDVRPVLRSHFKLYKRIERRY